MSGHRRDEPAKAKWSVRGHSPPIGRREAFRLYMRIIAGAQRHPRAVQNAFEFFTALYRRDADFVATLRGVFEGESASVRALLAHIGALDLERTTAAAAGSLKGLAERLHRGTTLPDDLAAVPHLGCLADLSPVRATRWDYVVLSAQAVLDIKEAHPGLGLSGRRKDFPGGRATGLELAQSWSMLLNAGHLFGTFATERAVAYRLHRDANLRTLLIRTVDPLIRDQTSRVLDERPLYSFFEVLAAARISRWPQGALRTDAIHALRAFFEAPRDDPAMWAYRWSRRLAYTRLHAMLGVGAAAGGGRYQELLAGLRRWPSLGWAGEHERTGHGADLMNAFDAFNDQLLFASPDAARRVLAHLREFRRWWPGRTEPELDRLFGLFSQPTDWPKDEAAQALVHVGRIHLVDERTWVDEVVDWLGEDDGDVWGDSNFVVTPEHQGSRVHIDFYTPPEGLSPPVVHHVVRQLIRAWPRNREDDDFHMSVGSWLLQVMALAVLPEWRAVIQPVAAGWPPMTVVLGTRLEVIEALRRFASETDDDVRRDELKALYGQLERETGDGAWLGFLGKIRFVDRNNNEAAELDGVAGRVGATGIDWIVIERKDGRSGTGRRQLQDFRRMLVVDTGEPCAGEPGTTILRICWKNRRGGAST